MRMDGGRNESQKKKGKELGLFETLKCRPVIKESDLIYEQLSHCRFLRFFRSFRRVVTSSLQLACVISDPFPTIPLNEPR